MSFTIYENDVIMCTGENLLTYDLSSDLVASVSLPKLPIDDNDKQRHNNNLELDNYHGITAVFTSKNGTYFCACTNRKQLCLYERSSRFFLSNRKLARAASRARFTPSNDVIVADKSGDAYLFETRNPSEPGKLILGHLSMLLDCLVTENNEHIVTADRDEKIRVSRFPNAYNVVSYCLGHEKFVTAVAQLPLNESILVSSGGDGELKFWDYVDGKELASHNFRDKIPKEELDRLNESLESFELTETVETLPVKHLRIGKISEDRALLLLTFYSGKRILAYSVSDECRLEYLETVVLEEEPLECFLRNAELWILDDKGLGLYNFDGKKFQPDKERNEKLRGLNERWSLLRKSANKQSLFPILYKRKFDNVQEYRERKKSRLGN